MTEALGRRERKKAATRQNIAASALRLFREHGYDQVGIRDIAAEADVAVTTLFAHFESKEALVFEADRDFEHQLIQAATDRAPDQPLIPELQRQITAMVRHCSSPGAARLWRMIDTSPDLQRYEQAMRLRHAQALAAAIAQNPEAPHTAVATGALASFVLDAFSLSRETDEPEVAVEEIFRMIDAAWRASALATSAQPTATSSANGH